MDDRTGRPVVSFTIKPFQFYRLFWSDVSRPMMSLIARAPWTLSSSASESPVKRSNESQSLLSAKAKMYDRNGKPVVCRDTSHEQGHHHKQFVGSSHSARYSEWNIEKAWSSQEWKSDEWMIERGETRSLPSKRSTRFSITFISWAQAFYFGRRKSRWNGETRCLPSTRSTAMRQFSDRENDQVQKA